MTDLYDIYVRTPINGTTARAISFSYAEETEITTDDIKYILKRLQRKRKLLNTAIGITTKAQKRNLRYKISKGQITVRGRYNSRGVDEWVRNGDAIFSLTRELTRRKKLD